MSRHLSIPLHAIALDLQRRSRWAADAGRHEEALSILRLALDRLATASDRRTPALRAELAVEIASLEAKLGVAAPPTLRTGVAKTGPDDLQVFFDGVEQRRPLDVELSKRKAGER